jgi:hypothetical protein
MMAVGGIMSPRRKTADQEIAEAVAKLEYPEPLLAADRVVGEDVTAKVNAAARLVFAMYYHPQARELFASPLMTPTMLNAYMAAAKAWNI